MIQKRLSTSEHYKYAVCKLINSLNTRNENNFIRLTLVGKQSNIVDFGQGFK